MDIEKNVPVKFTNALFSWRMNYDFWYFHICKAICLMMSSSTKRKRTIGGWIWRWHSLSVTQQQSEDLYALWRYPRNTTSFAKVRKKLLYFIWWLKNFRQLIYQGCYPPPFLSAERNKLQGVMRHLESFCSQFDEYQGSKLAGVCESAAPTF